MAQLKRTLGLPSAIFFGVGSILGAGIYTIIGKVSGLAGNMLWAAFAIASITAIMTAFSYAELSAAYPKSGGEYEYAKRAFGKSIGVILGLIISLNGIISGATVAVGFAGYFTEMLDLNTIFATLGIIFLIFAVNVSGIRESSTVNIIFTTIEAGGLIFIIYAAFNTLGNVNLLEIPEGDPTNILKASALAFFAYIGFEEIVKLSEETKNPEVTIPRALFYSSIIVLVMYTLIAIVSVSAIPFQRLNESANPLALIAEASYGKSGMLAISIIALFATSNTILSNMLGSSRVLLNIGAETAAFKKLSKVSSKRKTPINALILILIVMSLFGLIGDIEIVARIANIFIFVTFIVVNLSVIVLRKKEKSLKRPYKIPGQINDIPIIPVLGVLFTLTLFAFNIYSLMAD